MLCEPFRAMAAFKITLLNHSYAPALPTSYFALLLALFQALLAEFRSEGQQRPVHGDVTVHSRK